MIIVEDTDEDGIVTRTEIKSGRIQDTIALFVDLTGSAMTARVIISGFTLCKWRRPVEVEGEAMLAELIEGMR
jgi:hypothetical protein